MAFGVTGSGQIEILFGEANKPLPFRHYLLKDVKRMGKKIVKTGIVCEKVGEDWESHSDLLCMAAIAEAGHDKDGARKHLDAGMKTWEGKDTRDRAKKRGKSTPPTSSHLLRSQPPD